MQVKEAAAHAAERAREAIEAVIPESAGKLSAKAREALERVIREVVDERLRGVEGVAARAVEAARGASDRLTQQMLTLGQSAAALEAHIEQTGKRPARKGQRGLCPPRRLADRFDEFGGDRRRQDPVRRNRRQGVGRLSEGQSRGVHPPRGAADRRQRNPRRSAPITTAIPNSSSSVNRYVHDFEAMLRRVLAERDGGMMAVTLMSSDMGKLYAALAPGDRPPPLGAGREL